MSSDAIEFTPLQATPVAPPAAAELERLNDVTVEVSVEIGRTRMTLGEAPDPGPGSVTGLPPHAARRGPRPRPGLGHRAAPPGGRAGRPPGQRTGDRPRRGRRARRG